MPEPVLEVLAAASEDLMRAAPPPATVAATEEKGDEVQDTAPPTTREEAKAVLRRFKGRSKESLTDAERSERRAAKRFLAGAGEANSEPVPLASPATLLEPRQAPRSSPPRTRSVVPTEVCLGTFALRFVFGTIGLTQFLEPHILSRTAPPPTITVSEPPDGV